MSQGGDRVGPAPPSAPGSVVGAGVGPCDLLVVAAADPGRLGVLAGAVGARYRTRWSPAPGWVVGVRPVVAGRPDPPALPGGTGAVVAAEGAGHLTGRDPARLVDAAARGALGAVGGDHTFVAVTPDGRGVLSRSPAGLAPLYVVARPGVVIAGTRLGEVAATAGDVRLDGLTVAIWGAGHGVFPDGRTFVAGVRILPGGHAAAVGPGRLGAPVRWWDPRPEHLPEPDEAAVAAHAAELRELLVDTLARDLPPAGGLVSLSGGVDSSSLVALAAGVVGRRVGTVSLVPPPGPALDHEMSYIGPIQDTYGVHPRWFVELTPARRVDMMAAWGARMRGVSGFPVVHPVLLALPGLLEEAAGGDRPVVLAGGEFGDEVTGSLLRAPDWAAHTPLRAVLAALGGPGRAHRMPRSRTDALRWVRHRVGRLVGRARLGVPTRLAGVVHPDVAGEYAAWRRELVARVAADRRPLAYLAYEVDHTLGWVAMSWEGCGAVGMARTIPFVRREVLQLAFRCHPAELVGPGEKRLLRRALAGDVPPRNLARTDRGAWARALPPPPPVPPRRLPGSLAGVLADDVVEGRRAPEGPGDAATVAVAELCSVLLCEPDADLEATT